MTKRWQQRPPGAAWGGWGDDGELGRLIEASIAVAGPP